ncbi:MAG: hypothetical protein KGL39_22385 [Patescibacteria group bacterium]|nr:hypothetical protein [Patescibacteria group bacterium]
MRLSRYLVLLAGGPGSGCRGPTCGRKPGAGVDVDKSARAKAFYKPSTQAKQLIADQSEQQLSKLCGVPRTTDNSAFDLLSNKIGVEVKTLIDNKNDKITMHPESRRRKIAEAQEKKLRMYTVVIDKRGKTPAYYYSEGVGSFRLGNLTAVRPQDLRKVIR